MLEKALETLHLGIDGLNKTFKVVNRALNTINEALIAQSVASREEP